MSFQAMAWAVNIKTDNAGQKLVLLMLSNYSNTHTGQCNPSHKRLAEECCMSTSSLKNHISWLELKGYIKIIPKFQDGVSLPNQYILNIEGVGQILADGGSNSGLGVGQPLATNLEVKPRIEPKYNPLISKAEEIIAYLNIKAFRNYKIVPANLNLIIARLKEGATKEECISVIDRKITSWLSDPKMTEYLRPATLFSAKNFAQYSGEMPASNNQSQGVEKWE